MALIKDKLEQMEDHLNYQMKLIESKAKKGTAEAFDKLVLVYNSPKPDHFTDEQWNQWRETTEKLIELNKEEDK